MFSSLLRGCYYGCLSSHVFFRSCVLDNSFYVIFHWPCTVPIQRTQVTKNAKNTQKCSWSSPFIEDASRWVRIVTWSAKTHQISQKSLQDHTHLKLFSVLTVLQDCSRKTLGKNILLKNASTFLAFFGLINSLCPCFLQLLPPRPVHARNEPHTSYFATTSRKRVI